MVWPAVTLDVGPRYYRLSVTAALDLEGLPFRSTVAVNGVRPGNGEPVARMRVLVLGGGVHRDDEHIPRSTRPRTLPDSGAPLTRMAAGLYDLDLQFLTGTRLTKQACLAAIGDLEKWCAGAAEDDLLVVYYGGHAGVDDDGHLRLVAYDTRQGAEGDNSGVVGVPRSIRGRSAGPCSSSIVTGSG